MCKYRSIDIEPFGQFLKPNLPFPQLAWLDIADLVIDDSYQRAIEGRGKKNIKNIAKNFDWAKFGAVMVSPNEDGKYAIIDGQHRAHAAAACGFDKVPALISNLSKAEQAAAFSAVNSNITNLTILQIYRAALQAQESWALGVKSAVEKAGGRVATSNYSSWSRPTDMVFAVLLIRKFTEGGLEEVVTVGVKAAIESYAPCDFLGVHFLRPWLLSLSQNQQYLKLELTRVLNLIDIDEFKLQSSRLAKREGIVPATAKQKILISALEGLRANG